jgi:DHA1 family bicyclomycin/chloramphenicol resistance-like MFS transporter
MNPTSSKAVILLTIILMDLLAGMEFDLFVPSFPELQHHFNLSPLWVEAFLSVNFIGYCLSLFFLGQLGDRCGPKLIIVWGLILLLSAAYFVCGHNPFPLCFWAVFFRG